MAHKKREARKPNSENSIVNKYFDIHGPVFWPSVILITILIIGALVAPETAEEVLDALRVGITDWASWLFVASVNIFIGFAL
ncbi:MAG: BCCT family transporter, partial [Balneolales bacterium]